MDGEPLMVARKYPKDIRNMRFTRLVAIEERGRTSDGRIAWLCRCDCGKEKIISEKSLHRGVTISCGCLGEERRIAGVKAKVRTHGRAGTPQYIAWILMKDRCYNQNSDAYRHYGGRGIKVCDRWRASYGAFLSDTGERPKGMTLDRINNDGDYEPGNVRWATRLEQARNTRRNRLITVGNTTKTLSEWAELTGTRRERIAYRLNRGRSLSDILKERVLSGAN